MKHWYRAIPVIGYIIEMIKEERKLTESPVFQLYHLTTGIAIAIIIILRFVNNTNI